jgi:hypothetical protein
MASRAARHLLGKYVLKFIRTDIGREIALAHGVQPHGGGGNLLGALGLICYTEFIGSFVTGTKGRTTSASNFMAFFCRLGPEYRALSQHADVYDIFRNGLAHEYFIKGSRRAKVYMVKKRGRRGVGVRRNGGFYICVEQYLEDLLRAAAALRDDPGLRLPANVPGNISKRRACP